MSTKKLISKILLKKTYCGESIIDIEEDVYSSIEYDKDIPVDEYGFSQGEYEITLTWKQINED